MKRKLFIFIWILAISKIGFSQDLLEGNKIWYSSYIYFKVNNTLFVDAYILTGFNALTHSFSFSQNDFALNFKFNKKQSVYFGYTMAAYKWIPSYSKRYDRSISPLGTVSFNRFFAGYKNRIKIYKVLRIRNDLGVQYYFPKLEKYQFRFSYKGKMYLYNRKWPLRFTPFFQFSLYYYLNGMPSIYYNSKGNVSCYKSPNGFHRYRLKFGYSIKPIQSFKQFSLIMYYAIQREFNIPGFGNDLNIIRPGSTKQIVYPYTPMTTGVRYPFNDFNIYGLQLNLIF